MVTMPNWLPNPLDLDGNWERREKELYRLYREIFFEKGCFYQGKPVHVRTKISDPPFEDSFWHLITREDKHSGDRMPDFLRASRLHWIPAILENSSEASVLTWEMERKKGQIRRYVWLKDLDFIIVLFDSGPVWILFTAFYVDTEWSRRNFERDYRNRIR